MKLHRNLCEAVIQALTLIFDEKRYADKVIEKILKQNPKWGGRDRRFIAETTYNIVRWYRLLIELSHSSETDYWRLLGVWLRWKEIDLPLWSEFNGLDRKSLLQRYEGINGIRRIRESYPDWLDALVGSELGEAWDKQATALNEEARVVLRVNTLKLSRAELQQRLKDNGVETEASSTLPDALLLTQRQNVFTLPEFKEGMFEVQDGASQLVAPFLEMKQGLRVIDACAGGGGKTLHLAALLKNTGRIISLDTEEWKLDELKKRARRAGVSNVETRIIDSNKVIKRLAGSADRLLLDVPCSGIGVIKRNPDAKWKLSIEFIHEVKELQRTLLQGYSSMLKPEGLMVYSTCSILPSENEDQIRNFLEQDPSFHLIKEHKALPSEGFDGFYMALLKKK